MAWTGPSQILIFYDNIPPQMNLEKAAAPAI